jgi:hypothetical protein
MRKLIFCLVIFTTASIGRQAWRNEGRLVAGRPSRPAEFDPGRTQTHASSNSSELSHESEMLSVRHAGRSFLAVPFSL